MVVSCMGGRSLGIGTVGDSNRPVTESNRQIIRSWIDAHRTNVGMLPPIDGSPLSRWDVWVHFHLA